MAERRSFDPSRIRRPKTAPPTAGGPLTVHQLNEMVRGIVAQHAPATVQVLGELGNVARPASGHLYLTLKDAHAEVRCVMWRSTAARLKFTPEVGMEVIATGAVEVYTPRGTYQLIARKLEPRGVGALEVAFRQLKEKLEAEGLFDRARKRALPRLPGRIAVVTSPTGAAIRDILQTLRRRNPGVEVLVFPVRVQGDTAADEIATAIRDLNRCAGQLGGIDVAIVGRGGGALEDLWPFNEEVVARAIAASRVPIISAVGHEVDVTISDLVADLRAPTPTAGAELVAPPRDALEQEIGQLRDRADRHVRHSLRLMRSELELLLAAELLARPLAAVQQRAQLLDELIQRLHDAQRELLRGQHERLSAGTMGLLRFRAGARFVRSERDLDRRLYRLRRAHEQQLLRGDRHLTRRLADMQRWHPSGRVRAWRVWLEQTPARLARAADRRIAQGRGQLAAGWQALRALDPRQVLVRGYSITRDARTRAVIRSVEQIRDKLRVITEVADGSFHATADDPRQPGLFDEPPEPGP